MFENIVKFFKKLIKTENKGTPSKDTAKERLHLVLMQDRANVSADFLELMKQEIIEVIKKYIDVEESAIDVRLTNEIGEDGSKGAPSLYANIPIKNIKNGIKNEENSSNTNNDKPKEENKKEDNKSKENKEEAQQLENKEESKNDNQEQKEDKVEDVQKEEKVDNKQEETKNEEEQKENTKINENEEIKEDKKSEEIKDKKEDEKEETKETVENKN